MADAPYTAWDDTDASNTAIDGHDISENCIPNGLNNAMRAWRGSLARLFHSLTGQKVTAGTADAQTLTTGLSLSGMPEAIVGFTAGASLTNTGACTLAVDSMGVVSVKVPDGAGALADPVAGAISAGGIYIASYDTTAGVWVLINPSVLGALSNYLPLAGGALTGALTARGGSITATGGVAGASDMATTATFRGEIEVRGDGAGAAMMTFHRPFGFAGYFGIDTDNVWKVGGWSHGANAYQIWHAGANVDGRDIAADGAKLDGIEAGATRNSDAASRTQDDEAWYGMMLGTVTNGDYRIILHARRAGTIGQTTTRCASGTATATFKINGAALGGAANSVSSSEQTQAHASANIFAVGDDIVITITSASSLKDMSFSIEFAETMD